MGEKTKFYFKLCKKTFNGEELIGWINDSDFIIPSKGDIININEEQIRVWNGEYTYKDLEVIRIKYEYNTNIDGIKFCTITIYVK